MGRKKAWYNACIHKRQVSLCDSDIFIPMTGEAHFTEEVPYCGRDLDVLHKREDLLCPYPQQ